jgi:uncharacterized cofD-like protein
VTARPAAEVAVVALGGGHGLAASLTALRSVTSAVTAVVTVADDGGSSGRLRQELGALPPGDLRMALSALAVSGGPGDVWAALLQHRFGGGGALAGHPVGNLMITGLTETLGGPVAALDAVAGLLGIRPPSRVLPVSCTPMDLVAEVVGLDPVDPRRSTSVRGQVAIATTPGRVVTVSSLPAEPAACPAAVAAVTDADWVVLGPGSWFTSVLPHLMVPELVKALATTAARRLVVLNLAPQSGETSDFSPADHLDVLSAHAPELPVDVVLADSGAAGSDGLRTAAAALAARLVFAPLAVTDDGARHDPVRLAAAYDEIFSTPNPPGAAAWR